MNMIFQIKHILTLKLQNRYSIRDALVTVLHAFDYEHDTLSTPRIAGLIEKDAECGYLGIITKESLVVQRFELECGKINYIATYEHYFPNKAYSDNRFDAKTAKHACQYILGQGVFSTLEKPITAACAIENGSSGFKIAVANPK